MRSIIERITIFARVPMLRWYLVRTRPFGERIAQVNLERQGYEIYFPQVIARTRKRARSCEVVLPLFPRYLFLRLDPECQSLAPVRSTLGVANIVRFGLRHAVVPDNIVQELRMRADGSTGLHVLEASRLLAAGMQIQIVGGTLQGLDGVFARASGADRVTILLDLMGHEVSVKLPLDFVAPSRAAA